MLGLPPCEPKAWTSCDLPKHPSLDPPTLVTMTSCNAIGRVYSGSNTPQDNTSSGSSPNTSVPQVCDQTQSDWGSQSRPNGAAGPRLHKDAIQPRPVTRVHSKDHGLDALAAGLHLGRRCRDHQPGACQCRLARHPQRECTPPPHTTACIAPRQPIQPRASLFSLASLASRRCMHTRRSPPPSLPQSI